MQLDNSDDADEGGEWVPEPFLDQFKIHTPTSAATSRQSLWSSPASPPRESFEDIIRRMQAELKVELEAMQAKPVRAEPPGFGAAKTSFKHVLWLP